MMQYHHIYLFIVLLFFSCTNESSFNIFVKHDEQLFTDFKEELFVLQQQQDEEAVCTMVTDGAKLFSEQIFVEQLIEIYFLLAEQTTSPAIREFIYFTLAEIYWQKKDIKLFVYCSSKLSEKTINLTLENTAIHYINGLKIIKLEEYDDLKINTYKKLLSHFNNEVDEILLYYKLSLLYKKKYEIDEAIEALKKLTALMKKTKNNDYPFTYEELSDEIKFFSMRKTWIYQDLSLLIKDIKYAINSYNMNRVFALTSKVGFFIKFFNAGVDTFFANQTVLNARYIGRGIVFADRFEENSNENEVFLETRGWTLPQMHTWYLYFKKVHYPYDENIDGGWEWKGIYFGNWL